MTAYQHDDSPETFSVFEVYKDEEALQAHMKASEHVAAAAELDSIVEGGLKASQIIRGKLVLGQ